MEVVSHLSCEERWVTLDRLFIKALVILAARTVINLWLVEKIGLVEILMRREVLDLDLVLKRLFF